MKLLQCIFCVSYLLCNCNAFELLVLHTNDVHSRFEEHNGNGGPCRDGACLGGMPRLATAVKKYRAENPNVIFVDGGDQFQGSIWYTILKWQPIAAAIRALKYTAISFGNHEFDDGLDVLIPYLENLKGVIPVVSSNVRTDNSTLANLYTKSFTKTVAGEKIGIIGYVTPETEYISNPGNTVHFDDVIGSVKKEVDILKSAGINKIIAIGHAGIKMDRKVCQEVAGLDIVVGGHTNTFLYTGQVPTGQKPLGKYPEVYGDSKSPCLVVQDYAFAKWLGYLKVNFNNDGDILSYSGNPVLLDGKFSNDVAMEGILQQFHVQLEKYKKTEIGVAAVALDGSRESCRLRECNLGNIVTDAMVYAYTKMIPDGESWTSAAIAVINGGGIRDFESEPWTKLKLEDLYTIHPFGNTVEMVTLRGSTIRKMLEWAVTDYSTEDAHGKFLQMSGLKVVYDLSQPNGHRVLSVLARCAHCTIGKYELLKDNEHYNVVTIKYLMRGGDGFSMIPQEKVSADGAELTDLDVLETYVKQHEPLMTGLEGRITFTDDKNYAPFRSSAISLNNCKNNYLKLLIVLIVCFFVSLEHV